MKKSNQSISGKKINFTNKEEEYRKINDDLELRKFQVLKAAENTLNERNSYENSSTFLKNYSNGEVENEETDLRPVSSSSSITKSRSSYILNSAQKDIRVLKKSMNGSIGIIDDFDDFQNYDDIMPAVANEMSDEAQIRFLKASLKVMKQDMDALIKDNKTKDEGLRELQIKFKEADEVRQKLLKSSGNQNSQVDKLRKQIEEYKEKNSNLEVQLLSIRKESEAIQKTEKQNQNSKGSIEIKLNKALEECEKYKSQVEKLKSLNKDMESNEKQQLNPLIQENRKLEKQRNELLNAYKKQMKLIDVYKRLQMHMEASRLLSFSEDEFIRALEINSNDQN